VGIHPAGALTKEQPQPSRDRRSPAVLGAQRTATLFAVHVMLPSRRLLESTISSSWAPNQPGDPPMDLARHRMVVKSADPNFNVNYVWMQKWIWCIILHFS
jgi:hypothetical protein